MQLRKCSPFILAFSVVLGLYAIFSYSQHLLTVHQWQMLVKNTKTVNPSKSASQKTGGTGTRVTATNPAASSVASSGKKTEINIVSMSLYGGNNPRYTVGALRNAELVKKNFPGWTLRFYVEKPSDGKYRYGQIPKDIIDKLMKQNVEIFYKDSKTAKVAPMMWRFMIADNSTVDRFIVRDSDSRLTPRDAAVVNAWVKSGKPFHCVRDHPSHSNFPLSGGMWGAKPKELKKVVGKSFEQLMRGYSAAYLQDMNFLGAVIWPKVKDHAYCSDSFSCKRFPNSHPFPVKRIGWEHVGQVYGPNDVGRPVDINILKNSRVNKDCVPNHVEEFDKDLKCGHGDMPLLVPRQKWRGPQICTVCPSFSPSIQKCLSRPYLQYHNANG